MPFSSQVKARIFVRSGRICALCFKQCGTNIEAAHIVAEAQGGSNDDDNAIPLCFDCHQETGAYNVDHPKGNKFTVGELHARRDKLYALVDSGTLQAQIIASQLHATAGAMHPTHVAEEGLASANADTAYHPSPEAEAVLRHARDEYADAELVPSKLKLLSARDAAYVVDQLVEGFSKPAAEALQRIFSSGVLEEKSVALLLEQLLRRATLMGTPEQKAGVLLLAPAQTLAKTDEALRTALFEDVISMMMRDQYAEVNWVTPAVVQAHDALPQELVQRYVAALMSQAESNGYNAGPAARNALKKLPKGLAGVAYAQLTKKELLLRSGHESLREFVAATQDYWPKGMAALLSDFARMSQFDFLQKHWKE